MKINFFKSSIKKKYLLILIIVSLSIFILSRSLEKSIIKTTNALEISKSKINLNEVQQISLSDDELDLKFKKISSKKGKNSDIDKLKSYFEFSGSNIEIIDIRFESSRIIIEGISQTKTDVLIYKNKLEHELKTIKILIEDITQSKDYYKFIIRYEVI